MRLEARGFNRALRHPTEILFPEPITGGFVCAATVSLLYSFANVEVSFSLEIRDFLLLYFFAGIR
ncbi:sodium/glutamate symporter [Photobacterium rosenbergii]|uniref:sodium/glutamate symporter n=1 Tax=Photobacterium rosenbergii TaxID=294936 RepID=UPI0039824DFE